MANWTRTPPLTELLEATVEATDVASDLIRNRQPGTLGGIDAEGQPLPMTYRRLRSHADTYVITDATPEGPRNLLRTARDMFALGFYSYEMVAAAAARSTFAVEAALKLRFDAGRSVAMQCLINVAKDQGLVSEYLADILDAGRQIRNRFVHEGVQPTWTFGMTDRVVGASFKIVSELYPDVPETSGR